MIYQNLETKGLSSLSIIEDEKLWFRLSSNLVLKCRYTRFPISFFLLEWTPFQVNKTSLIQNSNLSIRANKTSITGFLLRGIIVLFDINRIVILPMTLFSVIPCHYDIKFWDAIWNHSIHVASQYQPINFLSSHYPNAIPFPFNLNYHIYIFPLVFLGGKKFQLKMVKSNSEIKSDRKGWRIWDFLSFPLTTLNDLWRFKKRFQRF